jgi:uncharacterized protein (DUF779 family)
MAAETGRIVASGSALAELARLRSLHGPLLLFLSGGCCDGSSPMCLRDGELLLGPGDRRLGEVAGVPVYADAEQDDRWRRPRFELDVVEGAGSGFSLEGLDDLHFVVGSPSPQRDGRAAANR